MPHQKSKNEAGRKLMQPRIQNVVSTADLHQPIDARKLIQYKWGKYDPEIYGGRCGYIKDEGMQGRVSVFLSGKMISIGAKSVFLSKWQLERAMNLLIENKLAKQVGLVYKVQNIVATLDLYDKLEVKKVINSLPNYIYEPDNFPGIIYKSSKDRVSCLIFASGKVVIVGAKSERQLKNIAQEIAKVLIVVK
jgi:transcription initiation factor TFIID TATA-box-binding protein